MLTKEEECLVACYEKAGGPVAELARLVRSALERAETLEERLHKADGMANEVNILVRENRQLRAENARLAGRVEELEGAGHQALTVARDVLRYEHPSKYVRQELLSVELNLSAALSQKPSGAEPKGESDE